VSAGRRLQCRRRSHGPALLIAVLLAAVVGWGLLGRDTHALALTGRVRALFGGGDGPTMAVSGARDGCWSNQRITLTLAATGDAFGSGVASISYVLDGVARTVVAESLRVRLPATEGAHKITYSATDKAGTSCAASTLTVHIDRTGPFITGKAVEARLGETCSLAYKVNDVSPTATTVVAVIRDEDGAVVRRISLGDQRTGVRLHCHWRPPAAGVYTYAIVARDLSGNPQRVVHAYKVVVAARIRKTIGRSVQGRRIAVVRFGSGARRLLVVGGVHPMETGTRVAGRFAAYLRAHPEAVPSGWRIDVIPCLNPDGLAHGTRGNADDVDLNRNFPSSRWRHRLQDGDPSRSCGLNGGPRAGSEPETRALIAYLRQGFAAVLSLHSDAGILDCHGPGSTALGRRMAALCGLPVGRLGYEAKVTGTLEQYVVEHYGIPAIMVELHGTGGLDSGMRRALLAACR
jgi:murein peptide amidase A